VRIFILAHTCKYLGEVPAESAVQFPNRPHWVLDQIFVLHVAFAAVVCFVRCHIRGGGREVCIGALEHCTPEAQSGATHRR